MAQNSPSAEKITLKEFFGRMHATHFIALLSAILLLISAFVAPAFLAGFYVGQNSKLLELIASKNYLIQENDSLKQDNANLKTKVNDVWFTLDSTNFQLKPLIETAITNLPADKQALKEELKSAISQTKFVTMVFCSGDNVVEYALTPPFKVASIKVAFFSKEGLKEDYIWKDLLTLEGQFIIPNEIMSLPQKKWFNFVVKDEMGRSYWGLADSSVISRDGNTLAIENLGSTLGLVFKLAR